MKKPFSLMLLAASLYAASDVAVTPMGLPCDGVSGFPCSRPDEGGFLAQARSKAPAVLFELRYKDAEGREHTARRVLINDTPGAILFAGFGVGMYRTNVSRGTTFVSLRVIDLIPAEEIRKDELGY